MHLVSFLISSIYINTIRFITTKGWVNCLWIFVSLQAKRDPNDPENAMLGAVAGTKYLLKPLFCRTWVVWFELRMVNLIPDRCHNWSSHNSSWCSKDQIDGSGKHNYFIFFIILRKCLGWHPSEDAFYFFVNGLLCWFDS